MFEYYVYGCKIESNYRCPLLTEYVNQQIFYIVGNYNYYQEIAVDTLIFIVKVV